MIMPTAAATSPELILRTGAILPFGAQGIEAIRSGALIQKIDEQPSYGGFSPPSPQSFLAHPRPRPRLVGMAPGAQVTEKANRVATQLRDAVYDTAARMAARGEAGMQIGDRFVGVAGNECPSLGTLPGVVCQAAKILLAGRPVVAKFNGLSMLISPPGGFPAGIGSEVALNDPFDGGGLGAARRAPVRQAARRAPVRPPVRRGPVAARAPIRAGRSAPVYRRPVQARPGQNRANIRANTGVVGPLPPAGTVASVPNMAPPVTAAPTTGLPVASVVQAQQVVPVGTGTLAVRQSPIDIFNQAAGVPPARSAPPAASGTPRLVLPDGTVITRPPPAGTVPTSAGGGSGAPPPGGGGSGGQAPPSAGSPAPSQGQGPGQQPAPSPSAPPPYQAPPPAAGGVPGTGVPSGGVVTAQPPQAPPAVPDLVPGCPPGYQLGPDGRSCVPAPAAPAAIPPPTDGGSGGYAAPPLAPPSPPPSRPAPREEEYEDDDEAEEDDEDFEDEDFEEDEGLEEDEDLNGLPVAFGDRGF